MLHDLSAAFVLISLIAITNCKAHWCCMISLKTLALKEFETLGYASPGGATIQGLSYFCKKPCGRFSCNSILAIVK